MKKELKSFLGTGWSFPPSFSKYAHSVSMVSEIDDIRESILIILNTFPGERLMEPKFGCFIKELVFEINNENLITKINDMIYRALLNFEPRVKFINAEILEQDYENGLILITINFTVIITNTRHNIVFPFYFNEGTNVPSDKQ